LVAGCADSEQDLDTHTSNLSAQPIPELALPTRDFFVDVSASSGIQFGNFLEDPLEGTAINDHSRLAFADLNGDGFDDVVMHSLFPNAANGVPFEHLIFLNDGTGQFVDHSDASGLREVQAAFFAFADVDNDGDQDLFAGLDLLDYADHTSGILLNDGQGHFERVAESGVEEATSMAANATFGDFDGDAVLDLFVGNGGTTYSGPDSVYLGRGDGTFVPASERLGAGYSQPSNGSVTCDFDDDLDLDIFVSTYSVSTSSGWNHLWRNDGSGHFTDVAHKKGFAYQETGNYHLESTGFGTEAQDDGSTMVGSNGFGLDCGDVNNDGLLDVLLTAISHPVDSDHSRKWSDPTVLLINQGPDAKHRFVNAFLDQRLPFNEGDVDGAMVDFDNDGRLDLSMSRDRKYEVSYDKRAQQAWFGLMHQLQDGTFNGVGYKSGINDPNEADLRMKGAQNHAWSDIDGDGDLDLLVGGRDQGGGRANFLFRNELGHHNRWMAVRVVGDGVNVNADAIGVRVEVSDGEHRVVREKKTGRGMYNSEDTRTLHFGVGMLDWNKTLTVRWPDGTVFETSAGPSREQALLEIRYPDQIEVR
jgi:enediyne biosynthesis protein E4